MTLKTLLKQMTKEEKKLIEDHAIAAAVAMANYWDALRTIETAYGVEFDGTSDAISSLASGANVPATRADFQHISAKNILEHFDMEEDGGR